MTNFARIIDNVAVDVSSSPAEQFHPIVAAEFQSVPDEVEAGYIFANGQWAAPKPAPPAPRTWLQVDVRAGLSLSEKVKWDNDSAPEIVTVKAELSTPQELAATTELLQFLVDTAVIAQASMDKVLK